MLNWEAKKYFGRRQGQTQAKTLLSVFAFWLQVMKKFTYHTLSQSYKEGFVFQVQHFFIQVQ